jgi:hypothetical protein
MKNRKYEIIGLAILLIGGYVIFKKVKEAKDLVNNAQNVAPEVLNQKESDIDTIVNAGKFNGLRGTLDAYSPSFLKDWARAVLNNQAIFTHSNVKYNMLGGSKVTKK